MILLTVRANSVIQQAEPGAREKLLTRVSALSQTYRNFAVNQTGETFAAKEFGSADVSEFELTLLRGRCRWSQMVADGRLARVRSMIQAQPALAVCRPPGAIMYHIFIYLPPNCALMLARCCAGLPQTVTNIRGLAHHDPLLR
jgi:hypothetical protein